MGFNLINWRELKQRRQTRRFWALLLALGAGVAAVLLTISEHHRKKYLELETGIATQQRQWDALTQAIEHHQAWHQAQGSTALKWQDEIEALTQWRAMTKPDRSRWREIVNARPQWVWLDEIIAEHRLANPSDQHNTVIIRIHGRALTEEDVLSYQGRLAAHWAEGQVQLMDQAPTSQGLHGFVIELLL